MKSNLVLVVVLVLYYKDCMVGPNIDIAFMLSGNEVPQVVTTKVNVLQHGDTVTIKCMVTNTGSLVTKVNRISWFKDGEMMEENPEEPRHTIDPMVIRNAGAEHGGNYTCFLEIMVRNRKHINISDTTQVQSKLA